MGSEADIRMDVEAKADISVGVEAGEVIWMLMEAGSYSRRVRGRGQSKAGSQAADKVANSGPGISRGREVRPCPPGCGRTRTAAPVSDNSVI